MLKKAGFSKIRFHVALPDYKLPEEFLDRRMAKNVILMSLLEVISG